MSRRTRRSIDIFNLSFLDVVSCGFGAIILLLVIVKISEPHVIEQLAVDLSGLVAQLEAELHEIRGETVVLNRELTARQEQLSEQREKLARLQGDISSIRGQYATTRNEHDTQTIIEGQLASAKQELTEEIRFADLDLDADILDELRLDLSGDLSEICGAATTLVTL